MDEASSGVVSGPPGGTPQIDRSRCEVWAWLGIGGGVWGLSSVCGAGAPGIRTQTDDSSPTHRSEAEPRTDRVSPRPSGVA